MIFLLLKKLKALPDLYLVCLTILLFPFSLGTAVKLIYADNINFKNGNTEISLGEVVQKSDRLIEELQQKNQALIEANQKLQVSAKQRRVNLPELAEVEKVLGETGKVTADLEDNNKELQDIVESTK